MKIELWNIPEGYKRQMLWYRQEVSNRDEIDNIVRRNNGKLDCYITTSYYSKTDKEKPKTFIDGHFTSVLSDYDGLPLDKRLKKQIEIKLTRDGIFDSSEYNETIDKIIELKKYLSYNDMLRVHKYFEDMSLIHTVFYSGRFFHVHLINSDYKFLAYPDECLYNTQSFFDNAVRKEYLNNDIISEIKKEKGLLNHWLNILTNENQFNDVLEKAIEGNSFYFGADKQLFGDISRHGRIEYSINPKSGNYCNPLTHDQIHLGYDEIEKICQSKNICDGKDIFIGNKTLNPVVFDRMKIVSKFDGLYSEVNENLNEVFLSSEDDLFNLMRDFKDNEFVDFIKSCTMPCLWRIFDREPEHTLRWQFVRFFYELGYNRNDLILIFKKFKNIWRDYDIKKTEYQIKTIYDSAKADKSELRSCKTMKILGLCITGCKGIDDIEFFDMMRV